MLWTIFVISANSVAVGHGQFVHVRRLHPHPVGDSCRCSADPRHSGPQPGGIDPLGEVLSILIQR